MRGKPADLKVLATAGALAGVAPPITSTLEIKAEPVTSVTLRVEFEQGGDHMLNLDVRRMLLGYLTRMEDFRAGAHDLETFTPEQLGIKGTEAARLIVTCNEEPDQFAKQLADLSRLRPAKEYTDNDGPVLWWPLHHGQIDEPPTVGTPTDSDWPYDSYSPDEYALYWSPLPDPSPIT